MNTGGSFIGGFSSRYFVYFAMQRHRTAIELGDGVLRPSLLPFAINSPSSVGIFVAPEILFSENCLSLIQNLHLKMAHKNRLWRAGT